MADPQDVSGAAHGEKTAVVPPLPAPQSQAEMVAAALKALLDPAAQAALAARSKQAAAMEKKAKEEAAKATAKQKKAEAEAKALAAKARETVYEAEVEKLMERRFDDPNTAISSTLEEFVVLRQIFKQTNEALGYHEEANRRSNLHSVLLVACLLILVVLVIQSFKGRGGQSANDSATSAAEVAEVPASVAEGAPAATSPAPAVSLPAPVAATPKAAPVIPKEPFVANCSNETPGLVTSASASPDNLFHGQHCLPVGTRDGEIIAVKCSGKVRNMPPGTPWKKGFQAESCRIEK